MGKAFLGLLAVPDKSDDLATDGRVGLVQVKKSFYHVGGHKSVGTRNKNGLAGKLPPGEIVRTDASKIILDNRIALIAHGGMPSHSSPACSCERRAGNCITDQVPD